jgi:G3E family GTPase
MNETNQPIPVTILTGFLGAGKTTLLNRILQENHGHRIAVIENEFGETGIDHELVIQAEEEIFEMNNGCICCTVRGDLLRILGNLLKRKAKFDHILIETTGMAEPGPVLQTFFMDDEIREQTVVNAVVTLVDAAHAPLHFDSEEVREQVAFADILLLNKCDLVNEPDLQNLEERLRGINSFAKIQRTVRSEISIAGLMSASCFDVNHALAHDPDFLNGHHHHHHQDDITSVGLEITGDFDGEKLNQWLSGLLSERGQDIFRTKGIFAVKGTDKRLILQAVHMSAEAGFGRSWGADARRSRLVFIGRNLNREELETGIRSCLVQ